MTVKQIFSVVMRQNRQIFRSAYTIPTLVLFPVFFLGMYYFGFSNLTTGASDTLSIAYVNQDLGIPPPVRDQLKAHPTLTEWFPHDLTVLDRGFGYELALLLNTTTFDNSSQSKNVFSVHLVGAEMDARRMVADRKADIAIIVGPEFSSAVLGAMNSFWNNSYGSTLGELVGMSFPPLQNTTMVLVGDQGSLYSVVAEIYLQKILESYSDFDSYFTDQGGQFYVTPLPDTTSPLGSFSVFFLMTPGLIGFGLLMLPTIYSAVLCEEFRPENPTFDRMWLAPMSGSSYLLGSLVVQFPLFAGQIVCLFACAAMLGFNPPGNLFLGMALLLTILPFSAGISYLAAAFFSDQDVAGGVTGFATPVLGFASGAFVPSPPFPLLEKVIPVRPGVWRDLQLWDLSPLTHAINALENVLLYNHSLAEVWFDLLATLVLSTLFLVVSIAVFTYFRFVRRGAQ